ncbi:MAG: S49 family peptidase [bacterium]|nr:S49 family peptidase [bacterium]
MSNLLKRIMLFKICKYEINYSIFKPWKWKLKWSFFKKIIKGLVILIIFLGAFITVKDEVAWQFGLGIYSDSFDNSGEASTDTTQAEETTCNVVGIELHGEVVAYISPESEDGDGNPLNDETASENVVLAIEDADKDETVKAIILEVDSYGGSPVAAEEIGRAMKRATKPTVALVRTAAISAAYLASTGANVIFASVLSDIGGIGVTMSYLDSSKQNIKDGLTYNSLSSGKFKDYGDPDKPLTSEERELLMRDINIMNENFIKAVAANRNLDVDKVRLLADGSSLPGQMALENGLIDRIGGMVEVKEYLKKKIGKEAEVCW